MYLTRLSLIGDELTNPYEIHRMLWRTFPEAPDHERDFLFRIEQRNPRAATVLMQSLRQPNESTSAVRILACKEFELNLRPDMRLNFALIANPTKMIKDEDGRLNAKGEAKKCRVPLIAEAQQIDWLKRKLNAAVTVEVETIEIDKLPSLNFSKDRKRGKIQPYSFKGMLQVTDPMQLKNAIKLGIGPAKAFGCGLMLVRRI